MGTLKEPVPVTGLAENFSPIPLIAPPPFGSDIEGGVELPPSEASFLIESEAAFLLKPCSFALLIIGIFFRSQSDWV